MLSSAVKGKGCLSVPERRISGEDLHIAGSISDAIGRPYGALCANMGETPAPLSLV